MDKIKNKYRLPPDAYDRKNDRGVSKEYVKSKLLGEEKRDIIDTKCTESSLEISNKGGGYK